MSLREEYVKIQLKLADVLHIESFKYPHQFFIQVDWAETIQVLYKISDWVIYSHIQFYMIFYRQNFKYIVLSDITVDGFQAYIKTWSSHLDI